MIKVGIIGGSGLYEVKGLAVKERKEITTPFGKPSGRYVTGQIKNMEMVFLPRHGSSHNIPPHMINYRANIWGFKKLGVRRLISISAVGGITKGMKPGDIIILEQIIDMTKTRKSTFYEGRQGVIHIDFTNPYCPQMKNTILKAGRRAGVPVKAGKTYVAVEGPRLETAAEIRAFGMLGADVVGMTAMPEASLSRELEMCYSGISVVANDAAGISRGKLTTSEVIAEMKTATEKIKNLLKEISALVPQQRTCDCGTALKDAKI